jgi:hypothetical protein
MHLSSRVYMNDNQFLYCHPQNFKLLSVTQSLLFRAPVMEVLMKTVHVLFPEGAPM